MDIRSSKLVRTLTILKVDELKSLRKFIDSPYFNTNVILLHLFDALAKYHPTYSAKSLTAEKVFKKIFPTDEKYNKVKLSKKMTELGALLLKFMANQELEKGEHLEQSLYTKFLGTRKDKDLFQLATKNFLKNIEDTEINTSKLYLQKSMAYNDLYDFSILEDNLGKKELFDNTLINLDRFYVLKKLEFACSLLSRNQLIDENNKPLLQGIEAIEIEGIHEKEHLNFKIYKNLLELYKSKENDDLFLELLADFKSHYQHVAKEQGAAIIYHLANYAFARVKAGKEVYLFHALDLYKIGIKHDLFLVNGILSDITFLNVVATSALLKDFDFLKNLKEDQLQKVHTENKDQIEYLLMAYWHFHENNFDAAYENVLALSNKTIPFQVRSRILKLKCLYEMQKKHERLRKNLTTEIISFERYYNRELKLSPNAIKSQLNFSSSIKSLINKSSIYADQDYIDKIREQIINCDPIMGRKWLLEKVEEMKIKR